MNNRIRGADDTYSSQELEASALAIGKPALLYHVHVYNSGAAATYLHVFDKATAPTGGDIPVVVARIAAATHETLRFDGRPFSLGIGVALSAAVDSLSVGSADAMFDVGFTQTSGS